MYSKRHLFINELSQHTAAWDQFTPSSHIPHGYRDGTGGPVLSSISPHSNRTSSVTEPWYRGMARLCSLYMFDK